MTAVFKLQPLSGSKLQTTSLPDWQLQDAKNRSSQVVRAAREGVPQWVTVHGKRAAVVFSTEAYEAWQRGNDTLAANAAPEPKMSLVDALRMDLPEGGLTDEEVDALFARPKELSRAHGYEF